MKHKVLLIAGMVLLILFGFGITYSFFHSASTLRSPDQNIAKFLFNAENLDYLEIPLIDLKPGDIKEYTFSVSNSEADTLSDVTIEYQMIVKTYHLAPLMIELYKADGENEELILNCDETYTRNENNELICNTPIQEMDYSSVKLDSYKLKVTFPSQYNSEEYIDLVDYINMEIKSWQKTAK